MEHNDHISFAAVVVTEQMDEVIVSDPVTDKGDVAKCRVREETNLFKPVVCCLIQIPPTWTCSHYVVLSGHFNCQQTAYLTCVCVCSPCTCTCVRASKQENDC